MINPSSGIIISPQQLSIQNTLNDLQIALDQGVQRRIVLEEERDRVGTFNPSASYEWSVLNQSISKLEQAIELKNMALPNTTLADTRPGLKDIPPQIDPLAQIPNVFVFENNFSPVDFAKKNPIIIAGLAALLVL